MTTQTVRFDNDDGLGLVGALHWPAARVRAFVLFAHCFTCTRRSKAAVKIARALNRAGFAVMTFDFTGLGDSGGEFAATNFTTNVADLVAAARYLEAEHTAPAVLIGHSFGGTAALAAAPRIPSCRAVATLAAPARAAHVTRLMGGGREALERDGAATVEIGERPFKLTRQFLDDVERQALPESLSELRAALMIMHAPLDKVVSIDNAAEIFAHAVHPKSFVSLDDADHLLGRDADAEYAAAVLAAWAARYLEPASDAAEARAPAGVLARTGTDGFTTDVALGRHALIADEPAAAGGDDLGPTPYELLAAALATCTSMTLSMYAARKRWPLTEARVRVEHTRIHAEDCADCETRDGRIDTLTRAIGLDGDLDAAQRARLMEIADCCPVHRTLTGEIVIDSLPE